MIHKGGAGTEGVPRDLRAIPDITRRGRVRHDPAVAGKDSQGAIKYGKLARGSSEIIHGAGCHRFIHRAEQDVGEKQVRVHVHHDLHIERKLVVGVHNTGGPRDEGDLEQDMTVETVETGGGRAAVGDPNKFQDLRRLRLPCIVADVHLVVRAVRELGEVLGRITVPGAIRALAPRRDFTQFPRMGHNKLYSPIPVGFTDPWYGERGGDLGVVLLHGCEADHLVRPAGPATGLGMGGATGETSGWSVQGSELRPGFGIVFKGVERTWESRAYTGAAATGGGGSMKGTMTGRSDQTAGAEELVNRWWDIVGHGRGALSTSHGK